MAALRSRNGISRVVVPDPITLPRPVVRAGLPCRKGCQDLPAVTRVGAGQVWITRWLTEGLELPYDMDWLWYAAILSVAAARTDHRIRFQSATEVQRLATQVGAGECGTALRRRMMGAMRRLAQAQFGWAKAELGDGNLLASRQLPTHPILRMSSALAAALWPADQPTGIQVDPDDTELWAEPTMAHLAMTLDVGFNVPRAIFRALAKRPHMMSLALVIAAYAQAASRPLVLARATWEILLTRNFQAPPRMKGSGAVKRPVERARERVLAAAAWLDKACCNAGFPGAVKIYDPTQVNAYGHSIVGRATQEVPERQEKKIGEPGRPKERWLLAVTPARPPFVRS